MRRTESLWTRRDVLRTGFAGAAATLLAGCGIRNASTQGGAGGMPITLILYNGKVTTLDAASPSATAIACANGRIAAVGRDADVLKLRTDQTRVIDLHGRRVIPGLNDSHMHIIRGGLNYNLELRWDGIWSLADALEMLRIQAMRTPAPQWVRVVGGWSEFQFNERRMPTLDEINTAAPDTPVFILNLYSSALLNRAALRALGYDKQTPNFDRGEVVRDSDGNPTGLLLAKPSAMILYQTLAMGPKLGFDDQLNSTRHFMREMNRLGVTSIIDAGGGGQNYPDDYRIIEELRQRDQMTLRISYDLFAQKAGHELEDFKRWVAMVKPGHGDRMLRLIGAGENLTWSAADFEIFTEPRPDVAPAMEAQLEPIVRLLAEARWPFRIHATYNESISRFLDVFERVNRDVPFNGLHWFIDHAETINDRNIDRVAAMGGGIAVQHRMMFQGEYFLERYGRDQIKRTPPIRKMLDRGLPVGGGTDATRVASYNPWVSLQWLTTGRTLGGLQMYDDSNILAREAALGLWTRGSAWFSSEENDKGVLTPGQLADLAVLSEDYFNVPESDIRDIVSVLTVVDGRIVYADGDFAAYDPPALPISPDWSPAKEFGGYGAPLYQRRAMQTLRQQHTCGCTDQNARHASLLMDNSSTLGGPRYAFDPGCSCFAF